MGSLGVPMAWSTPLSHCVPISQCPPPMSWITPYPTASPGHDPLLPPHPSVPPPVPVPPHPTVPPPAPLHPITQHTSPIPPSPHWAQQWHPILVPLGGVCGGVGRVGTLYQSTGLGGSHTCTMSLSATFPREEMRMSSPSNSTMAAGRGGGLSAISPPRQQGPLGGSTASPSNSAWPTPTMMMDMGSLAAWRGGTVKIYGVTLPLGTHGSVGCHGVPWGPPPVAAPPP